MNLKEKHGICTISLVLVLVISSCQSVDIKTNTTEVEQWHLGSRMLKSSIFKDTLMATKQLDSLLSVVDVPKGKMQLEIAIFLLNRNNREEQLSVMISKIDKLTLIKLCPKEDLRNIGQLQKRCATVTVPTVTHEVLQKELVKMYFQDQYARGVVLTDLLDQYDLSQSEVVAEIGDRYVDGYNEYRLKEIFKEYGFPTRKMVGPDAMDGVFYIIQHGSKEWQVAMLDDMKLAADKGDLEYNDYAYLYDRVQMHMEEPQKYGTQFKGSFDSDGGLVLHDLQNPDSVDYYRMEIGLMPLKVYQEITNAFYSGELEPQIF